MYIDDMLKKLHRFKEINASMSVTTILTLLEIAKAHKQEKYLSNKDIEEKLGCVTSTAHRNISYWGSNGSSVETAHGYVEVDFNIADRRYRVVKLTPKGKAFINQMFGD